MLKIHVHLAASAFFFTEAMSFPFTNMLLKHFHVGFHGDESYKIWMDFIIVGIIMLV